MTKHKYPVTKQVNRLDDIPSFSSEDDEAEYWGTHSLGPALLARMTPLYPDPLAVRRQRARPIAIRLDTTVLSRLRALAAGRGIGYQTLLKEFVARGVAEEEQRIRGGSDETTTGGAPSNDVDQEFVRSIRNS